MLNNLLFDIAPDPVTKSPSWLPLILIAIVVVVTAWLLVKYFKKK